MSLSNLPPPIRTFLDAFQTSDRDVLAATLLEDAVLSVGDRRYTGRAVLDWLATTSARPVKLRRTIDATRHLGEVKVTVLTVERGADGHDVDVHHDWHFAVNAGRVSTVRIEICQLPAVPPVVAAFFRAANRLDVEGLMAAFVDDALVNDRLQDYWGRAAIFAWATREIIGERLALHIVEVIEHHGQVVVAANVNGDFDRRGLPDPLVLNFHFSARADRILQLIILPTRSEIVGG